MPECQGCGGHVSDHFVRVMGHEGVAFACPNCANHGELRCGAAADPEVRDRFAEEDQAEASPELEALLTQ